MSRSIGADSKPRVMPSNSVTLVLALRKILHSLVTDIILLSWRQHRKAVWHECPFPDNPSKVLPADNVQYINGTCTTEHPHILALLFQIKTHRGHNTQSTYLNNNYCLELVGLMFWYHQQMKGFLWAAEHKGASYIYVPVSISLYVITLLLICLVGDLQHQNIQTVWPRSRVICYARMSPL